MGIETQGNGTESAQGQLAVSGDSFFVDSTNKQGILTTLSRFSMAMREVENTSESKAQLTKVLNNVLKNLDNAISSIASVQGDVGARLNTLDASRDLNLDIEVYSKKVLSEIESLDYAEASTRLSMQSLVLSATQQSFVKISQLSLFSYL
jgi:flagellar hook-associated protein 3 FlgL